MKNKKGIFIYANLLDVNSDGRVDMISFLDPLGRGIALAVDRINDGNLDQIHVFQDVTGDGKLDFEDKMLIEREAKKIFKQRYKKECQLELFIEDGEYG